MKVESSSPAGVDSKPGGGVSRRSFLRSLGGAVAASAALYPLSQGARGIYEKRARENFAESVEQQKITLKKLIRDGIEAQKRYRNLVAQYNQLVETTKAQPPESLEIRAAKASAEKKFLELSSMKLYRFDQVWSPFPEATPYAEELGNNVRALENFAILRVLYKEGLSHADSPVKDFSYHHNFSLLCLELAKVDQDRVKTRLNQLFLYAKHNGILPVDIPEEKILYSIVDDEFDFNITPELLEAVLGQGDAGWKSIPATHVNKGDYATYNDLKSYDVFDLNRLKTAVIQVFHAQSVADIFEIRDQDLLNRKTELGGVVHRLGADKRIQVFPAATEVSNEQYIPSNSLAINALAASAEFHFHATVPNESPESHGPSSADGDHFCPGIVFSSLDENSIRVYFVSPSLKQENQTGLFMLNVTCLGDIRRTIK